MRTAVAIALAVFLAACGDARDPVANEAANGTNLPAFDQATPNAAASPTGGPPTPNGAAPATAQQGAVPAALQGRWGLTPGDCTSTRGDAKGLLVVSPNGLRFYESRAVPAGPLETSANSISGDFAFTGEGQQWTKFQALEIQDNNLIRTERNPNASFTYVRCD